MTTPPEEPAATPAESPEGRRGESPAEAKAQTPAPPYTSPYAQPAPYAPGAFAPVMRAPREPWVNPAKRVQAALLAAVVALVLLFGGLAVGFAVGHHVAERGVDSRFERGYGPLLAPGAHPRHLPNGGQPGRGGLRHQPFPGQQSPSSPSPSPSATKSG